MPTLFRNLTLATMRSADLDLIPQGALVAENGRILWLGKEADLPAQWQHLHATLATTVDGQGGLLTPALIDCHTHLVWGGNHANEFKPRLHGVDYQTIAAAGGGILATVKATREASEQRLFESAKERAEALISQGVSCIEIKSGYGLSLDD